MTTQPTLYLHEEILLLALRDRKGTIASGTLYEYAIGGAVLAELMLGERIDVEHVKKRVYARLASPIPTGDAILDECLEKMRTAKRRAMLQTWVSRFASLRNLKHRLATQLCRRGILRTDENKLLLLFTRRTYPELDPEPERRIRARLERAIFTETGQVDPRTVVLVSIANSAGLLKIVFDRKRLKMRKKRIEQLAAGEFTGKATRQAIQAMQAAVTVAAIMPTIMASTTVHR